MANNLPSPNDVNTVMALPKAVEGTCAIEALKPLFP